jgi:two-component system CheB/CheR fusion protein
LRVAPGGETGEVAVLIDAFNEMLQELHAHEMERKRAEDALIQSEKLAATGRMAATIAHEINNPLASITNVVHLLRARARARGGDDLQEAELLNILNEEVVRVSHIVKSTLGIARQSAVPTSANLADLADDVLTLFERRFIARNISVTRRYGPNPEALVVSSDVRQVISNLVGNALDVLPNAGALLIAVHHSFDWRDPSRHGVRISVSDNGPGIPPDVRHRLFQPFFTTKAEMGTGLGLWVSRSMIEKAGGSIRFKSSTSGPHTGTCFSVFLPSHRENIDQQKGVA